MQMNVVDWRFT